MAWKELEYSRSQVIDAGRIVRDGISSEEEYRHALLIIDNWRAAHAYPMHVLYIHLRRMAQSNSSIIVAERLKRLDSIIGKLQRERTMNLWTMQDLGGCRVILPNIAQVREFADRFHCSRIRHIFRSEYDYIAVPRLSGYRSLHHVYQFLSDKKPIYNGKMSIEIQFRTRLQHLWATAVETLGIAMNTALKAGDGDVSTNRFFLLVSALFSYDEGTTAVPNTPNNIGDIVQELRELDSKFNFIKRLRAINAAASQNIVLRGVSQRSVREFGYYLLIMNLEDNTLSMKYFSTSRLDAAVVTYNELEKMRPVKKIDVVLVRVSSFNALKLAYPNYFSDIKEFVKKIESYLVVG